VLHPLGDRRVDVSEIAERALELALADRLGPPAQLGEERLDLELPVAPAEVVDLVLDNGLHLRNFAEPRRHRVVEPGAKVVDVEEPDARDLAGLTRDVCRDSEIDEDEGTLCALLHRRTNDIGADHGRLGGRRGDRHVGSRERSFELAQIMHLCAESPGDLRRALPRPVRQGDPRDPATLGGLERLQPDSTRTDDQNLLVTKLAQRTFCERQGHRARSCGVRADRGLGASAATCRDRGAEEQCEPRADRSLCDARFEGATHLAEDLRLAEHEGVETGGHTAQVTRDVLAGVHVEVVDKELARDSVRRREHVDELVARILHAGGQPRVELDAVARLQHGVLEDRRTALGTRPERADALAQLDRSGAMAEPETDESVHALQILLGSIVENRSMRALGIDVGGTFTDAVLVEDGEVRIAKVPTAAQQQESVVGAAVAVGAADVERFTHGTTIATNALLQRRGARTALVTNVGFEHVLHLRRQTRAHLYRPCLEHPPPLVPLERCVGVRGRTGGDGELVPLDLDTLPAIDAEAIAVSLLFSFRDADPERRVAAELRRRYPSAHVVASHEVAPEFREYERASTTAVDAYLGPVLSRYLGALAGACAEAGLPAPLVMRSSGGLATLEEAAAHAAFALLSGPAAGVVGAAKLAALAGVENALSFDMGGTSTDVCAIVGGEARREHERLVDGLPVRLPTLAVHTVGAGGGSIVWLDEGGALRVGPESAGADPGPACYGRGGERATVTDANLLLGRLPAILPGEIALDTSAAERALDGIDPAGVVDVVNAEMVRALRVVSVEQGLDPRDFALVAFGGAGPLHACELAEELGIATVLVPAAAGVLSALGLAAADERRDTVRTYIGPLADAGELPDEGEADLRYVGQSFELSVALGLGLAERFHDAHAARYGYADRDRAIELVAVRTADVRPARPVTISGPSSTARGPQVLELDGATAWVPAGWAGSTDPHGTLILRRAS
jgi:N-methylhydantoinase A